MPVSDPAKIRNVAVAGHRGTGKTSLVEAMLFQSGAVNRLGTVEAGTTVADWDDEEHKRRMSLAASVTHVTWQDRKINLIDTPGDPGFQGDTIAAMRVVEGALIVLSGVMGVEVNTSRVWERADALGLSRVLFVNMLDRERASFFRALEALQSQLSAQSVAIHLPIGSEHELTGIVDLLHMTSYSSPEGEHEAKPGPIPDEMADQVAEYREKLLDAVVETDEGLMERYLDGQELTADEVAHALKDAVTRGELFPVACGVASKNLGTTALLDLLVEGVPSPAKKESPIEIGGGAAAFVFKTIADPFAGRINVFRVLGGSVKADSALVNARSHNKERIGHALEMQGKEHAQVDELVSGDIGAVAKLKDTMTGDLLLDSEREVELPKIEFPEAVMSFAITPKAKGDEEKMATSLRRLTEEDPTLVMRRDPQTGEQLVSGMSQMHVEVAVDRLQRRFGVDVELHQPRVPYLETIRRESRPRAATRSRPVDAASSATATSCWSRSRATGLRVRGQDRRRRHSAELPARGRQRNSGGDGARRARRGPGAGRPRPAGGRLAPLSRLLRDGLQDRRLDGVQAGLREGRPGVARADHGGRGERPRRRRRRRERRSQLPPRPAAGDGARRRDDARSRPRCRWPRSSPTRRR